MNGFTIQIFGLPQMKTLKGYLQSVAGFLKWFDQSKKEEAVSKA